MRTLLICGLVATILAACGVDDETYDEVTSDEVAGKIDAASELRVRAGDTSVWMTTALSRRDGDQGAEYVLRGRASRDLTGGNAYIFDDPYGEYAARGPRSFEVRWVIASNSAPLLEGRQQFLALSFAPSATRPDHLTTRVIVRPRLDAFAGATSIYLTAELTPYVVDGRVVYRVIGRSSGAFTTVSVARGAVALSARRIADRRFAIDLQQADVDALAAVAGAELEVVLDGTRRKRAHLGLVVKSLAITTGDAYDTWPPPACTAETQACLAGLPAGTTDLSPCGEAVLVRACRR